jgi:GNAT superfamily N-acetyltransferase
MDGVRVEVVDADRARELRRSVLRPGTPPGGRLPGDGIDGAVHFAALDDDGAVLSTCFVFPDPWPFPRPVGASAGQDWHLRQMATDPGHRGRGAGAAVVNAVITFCARQPAGLLWCHARVPAIGFYERLGFRAVGAVHPGGEPPIPHRYMYRA